MLSTINTLFMHQDGVIKARRTLGETNAKSERTYAWEADQVLRQLTNEGACPTTFQKAKFKERATFSNLRSATVQHLPSRPFRSAQGDSAVGERHQSIFMFTYVPCMFRKAYVLWWLMDYPLRTDFLERYTHSFIPQRSDTDSE